MELSLWCSQRELAQRTEVPGETTAVASAEERPTYAFTEMCQQQVPSSRVDLATRGKLRLVMQDANMYRQYAAECRRIAETMTTKDKDTLLRMAKLWDDRAAAAEQAEKNKK